MLKPLSDTGRQEPDEQSLLLGDVGIDDVLAPSVVEGHEARRTGGRFPTGISVNASENRETVDEFHPLKTRGGEGARVRLVVKNSQLGARGGQTSHILATGTRFEGRKRDLHCLIFSFGSIWIRYVDYRLHLVRYLTQFYRPRGEGLGRLGVETLVEQLPQKCRSSSPDLLCRPRLHPVHNPLECPSRPTGFAKSLDSRGGRWIDDDDGARSIDACSAVDGEDDTTVAA